MVQAAAAPARASSLEAFRAELIRAAREARARPVAEPSEIEVASGVWGRLQYDYPDVRASEVATLERCWATGAFRRPLTSHVLDVCAEEAARGWRLGGAGAVGPVDGAAGPARGGETGPEIERAAAFQRLLVTLTLEGLEDGDLAPVEAEVGDERDADDIGSAVSPPGSSAPPSAAMLARRLATLAGGDGAAWEGRGDAGGASLAGLVARAAAAERGPEEARVRLAELLTDALSARAAADGRALGRVEGAVRATLGSGEEEAGGLPARARAALAVRLLSPLAARSEACGAGAGARAALAAPVRAATEASTPLLDVPGEGEHAAAAAQLLAFRCVSSTEQDRRALLGDLVRAGLLPALARRFSADGATSSAAGEAARGALLAASAASPEVLSWALQVPSVRSTLAGPEFAQGGEFRAHGAAWEVVSGGGVQRAAAILEDAVANPEDRTGGPGRPGSSRGEGGPGGPAAAFLASAARLLQLLADVRLAGGRRASDALADARLQAALRAVIRELGKKPGGDGPLAAADGRAAPDNLPPSSGAVVAAAARPLDPATRGDSDSDDEAASERRKLDLSGEERTRATAQRHEARLRQGCVALAKHLLEGARGKAD